MSLSWRRQVWPLALVVVFYVIPLQFLAKQPAIHIYGETALIPAIAGLIVGLLFGIASLVFITLTLVTIALRIGRPANIRNLRRTYTYAASAAGLGLPVVAIVLALTNPLYALAYAALVGVYLAYTMPGSRRRFGYRSTITVQCAPEAAFAFISDPHNWPRYLPELQVIEPFDIPLRIGSTVRERATFGRRVIEGQDEVTIVDPNRKFGMRVAGRKDVASDLYEFRPVDAGTEISYTAELRLPISEAVIGGVLSRGASVQLLSSRREAAMLRIKQILEAPPAATV